MDVPFRVFSKPKKNNDGVCVCVCFIIVAMVIKLSNIVPCHSDYVPLTIIVLQYILMKAALYFTAS